MEEILKIDPKNDFGYAEWPPDPLAVTVVPTGVDLKQKMNELVALTQSFIDNVLLTDAGLTPSRAARINAFRDKISVYKIN